MTRWHCRLCKAWGLGGPDGWTKHAKAEHQDGNRYGAAMSFGFAPNYANGWRVSRGYHHWSTPRCEETP